MFGGIFISPFRATYARLMITIKSFSLLRSIFLHSSPYMVRVVPVTAFAADLLLLGAILRDHRSWFGGRVP